MLKTNVSGISTDVVLFSEHGAQLVHHYRVFGDCVAHASLRRSFIIELLYFTNRACAEARRWPNVAEIRVMGLVRHRIDRLGHTVVLCTTRQTTILRPGKLLGP